MKRFTVCLTLLTLVGCESSSEKMKLELERQRVMLQLLEQQQASLEALQKEENALRELSDQIENEKSQLEDEKIELQDQEKQQEARLRELEQKEEELRKLVTRQETNIAELKRQNALLEQMAELARVRRPFLEELAMSTAEELSHFAPKPPHIEYPHTAGMSSLEYRYALSEYRKEMRNHYYPECLRALYDSNVVLIPSEEEFKARAHDAMERFSKLTCVESEYEKLLQSRQDHDDAEHADHDHGTTEFADALAELSEEDRALATAQKTCPVSDEALGSMGTPIKLTVKERTVFVCCEACKGTLNEDPDKFLAKLDK